MTGDGYKPEILTRAPVTRLATTKSRTQTHITSEASERARLKCWMQAISENGDRLSQSMAKHALNGNEYPTDGLLRKLIDTSGENA